MARRKRADGEGSIYKTEKKLANGKVRVYWAGEIFLGFDGNGKKQVIRFSGTSQEAVMAKMNQAKADITKGILTDVPTRETVEQFLKRWLRDSVKHSVRPNTYRTYEGNVRNHINPLLGRVVLTKLTPANVQQLYAQKMESGLSPRSVQYIHAILHKALNQAVKWGLVPRNVCDAVDRPRATRKKMQVLTPSQVNQLFIALKGDRLEALYVLAVTTGMRQGEILGLTWGNVDLAAGRVQVTQQLQYLPKQGFYFAEPKSDRSRRAVSLPALAVNALKEHRKKQAAERLALGEAWQDKQGLVFTTTVGTPIDGTNLLTQCFRPLLEQAGLPPVRFHDLRHTAATLMLQGGVHAKVVQDMLGHSSITLTLDTYSHVLPSMQEEAAARMDAILAGQRDQA